MLPALISTDFPDFLVWGDWISNGDCNGICGTSGVETFNRVCFGDLCIRLNGTETTSSEPNDTKQEICHGPCPGNV